MKTSATFKTLLLLAITALGFGTQSRTAAAANTRGLALDVSEVTRIERLFSSGSHWTRPAPAVWSSRFEVRWNARWENSPQFAV